MTAEVFRPNTGYATLNFFPYPKGDEPAYPHYFLFRRISLFISLRVGPTVYAWNNALRKKAGLWPAGIIPCLKRFLPGRLQGGRQKEV